MAIKPLICSCGGISWAELKQWQLQTLATAKWVAVWSAHRGLTDCIYLAQVHERTSNSEDITPLPATNRRFRPHSFPPSGINFLIAAVQLPQQQQ
jgi:DNA polymerase-3 subunit epsilon